MTNAEEAAVMEANIRTHQLLVDRMADALANGAKPTPEQRREAELRFREDRGLICGCLGSGGVTDLYGVARRWPMARLLRRDFDPVVFVREGYAAALKAREARHTK